MLRVCLFTFSRADSETAIRLDKDAEEEEEDERTRSLIKEWLAHDGARPVSPHVPARR